MRRTALVALSFLTMPPLLAAGCGTAIRVQAYEGNALPEGDATVLWSNPHLDVNVDRNYRVPAEDRGRLHRIELPVGHHAVEVICIYSDGVTYQPAAEGQAATPARDRKYTMSPTIALVMDGEAGHFYKPRVRFTVDATGVPGCRARMFDITSEKEGRGNDFY